MPILRGLISRSGKLQRLKLYNSLMIIY